MTTATATRRSTEYDTARVAHSKANSARAALVARKEAVERERAELASRLEVLRAKWTATVSWSAIHDRVHKDDEKLEREIADCEKSIQRRDDQAAALDAALAPVHAEHSSSYVEMSQAGMRFQREPVEDALNEIDRLFRQLEQAWTAAAASAAAIKSKGGDEWGIITLSNIRNQLTNPHAQVDGPAVLHLPKVEV
jgi:predicted  nucleic acid-binding Zn-ribbon protein